MHFLNPIWFTAIAAVIIPLAIHLWNIRSGKILKVGSISLMGEASQQSSRSLRLQDILLLILRCLILIVLAGSLAQPFLSRHADNSKIKGWVMIPRQSFKETYAKFKKPVDSLTNAGYEFHYFDAAFTKVNLLDIAKDTTKTNDTTTVNYWNTLSRLNTKKPANLPVYLFTDNLMSHFGGSKPNIVASLHWQTYTPADSASEWVEKAWFTADNNIKIVKGNSNPRGTSYTWYTLQPGQNSDLFASTINNNGASISLKSKPQQSAIADTAVVRIAVVADNSQVDAAYLNGALKAIAPFIPHKVQLAYYNNAMQVKQKYNWLFWLANKPVDKAASDMASNLFIYQTGKEQTASSWLSAGNGFEVANYGAQVPSYKLIPSPENGARLVWRDGYGHAILSAEKDKNFTLYRFYSRFNPVWSDLVWNDNFPRMLLALMANDQPSAQGLKFDKRVLSAQQIMPAIRSEGRQTLAGISDNTDLSHYVWLVLIVLFVSERFLSHKKPTITNG
jgi:hypothetical protein